MKPNRTKFLPLSLSLHTHTHKACGAQNDTRPDFLRVLQFPLPILIPQTAPYSLINLSSRYIR
jgi:hypothetical protein